MLGPMTRFAALRLALILAACALAPAAAMGQALPGPIQAELLAVVDGDTVRVRARIWLDQWVETAVRLYGVDAPELHGACAAERQAAQRAKARLAELLEGRALALERVSPDKYAGRVDARLRADGEDVGARLLTEGLVRAYDGGRREGWCP